MRSIMNWGQRVVSLRLSRLYQEKKLKMEKHYFFVVFRLFLEIRSSRGYRVQ